MAYTREDIYDGRTTEEIAAHYREILRLLGEDPDREGLLKTPERVAKALQFLTKGYGQDGTEILSGGCTRPASTISCHSSARRMSHTFRTGPSRDSAR